MKGDRADLLSIRQQLQVAAGTSLAVVGTLAVVVTLAVVGTLAGQVVASFVGQVVASFARVDPSSAADNTAVARGFQ